MKEKSIYFVVSEEEPARLEYDTILFEKYAWPRFFDTRPASKRRSKDQQGYSRYGYQVTMYYEHEIIEEYWCESDSAPKRWWLRMLHRLRAPRCIDSNQDAI